MKVVILYRPNAEYSRGVETFIHDFKSRHQDAKLEVISIDSRDGLAMASLYDIMQFPAIMALTDTGSVLQMWLGNNLPRMDEVASYIFASR